MKRISKTIVFLTLLLTLSGNNLWAKFGIMAGTTLSLAGEESAIYNASNLFAAKAGFFYSFPITKSLSIQPEIYFAMKGGRYYSASHRAKDKATLNYIEIPVLLNIHLIKKFDFYLGPYISFLINSTEVDYDHDWTWIENEIRNNDSGISFGARYSFFKFLFA